MRFNHKCSLSRRGFRYSRIIDARREKCIVAVGRFNSASIFFVLKATSGVAIRPLWIYPFERRENAALRGKISEFLLQILKTSGTSRPTVTARRTRESLADINNGRRDWTEGGCFK